MQATAAEIERDPEALQQPAATDDNPLQPDVKTLTKPEACELLGKSERTVNTYMSTGRLAFQTIGGKAIFKRADVERLKADLATPVVRGVHAPILPGLAVSSAVSNDPDANGNVQPPAANGAALARIDPSIKTFAEAFALALRQPPAPAVKAEPKPWLNAEEASEYSGLPVPFLIAEARRREALRPVGSAKPPWEIAFAINTGRRKGGGWRFNRAMLGGAK